MPSANLDILCTRPLEPMLVDKAAEKGITMECLPFIDTLPVLGEELNKQLQEFAAQKLNVIFTSRNAVEAVAMNLPAKPLWKIYCLGGITKAEVYAHFGEATVKATAKNATALAEKIVSSNEVKQAVFFCGDQRLDELPEILTRHNIAVKEVVVYTTILTPKYVEKNYGALLFFSPSAVHSFFSMNTLPVNVVLFSIGKTTTATIRSYCTNKVVTSEWPGKEQMIELVMRYFN